MNYQIKKWGKLGVITLAPLLSLTMLGQPVYADTDSKEQHESIHSEVKVENATFSKEEAIQRVKELFPVLEKAEVESVQLGDTNRFPLKSNQMIWEIDWQYTYENGSHGFSSEVDARTGDILNVHIPSILTKDIQTYYPPELSKEEAKEEALDFIKQATPNQRYDELVSEEIPFYTNDPLFGPISYFFRFNPVVNGIPSTGQNYHIEITGNGGVESFHAPSDHFKYPEIEPVLSLKEATVQFEQDLQMQLTYITDLSNQDDPDVYLAWKPVDEQSSSQIQANTGKYVQEDGNKLGDVQSSFKEIPQKEEKFEALEPTDGSRINADQAASIVTSQVSIPEDKQLQQKSLREDGYFNYHKPIWELTWMKPGAFGIDNRLQAYVDAETGQLVEVTTRTLRPSSTPIEIDESDMLSEEELTNLALSKIQALYPNATKDLKWKMKETPDRYFNDENVVSFEFQRYLNDRPVQDNGVGMVLTRDGELIHYSVNETAKLEEKVKDLEVQISEDEALNTYLDNMKAELQYNVFRKGIQEDGREEVDILLIYKRMLKDVPHQQMVLDAESGNWRSRFSTSEEEQKSVPPTNLKGHWAEDELMTLAKHKILHADENGELSPSETITYGKWLQMISKGIEPNYERRMERSTETIEGISKDNEYFDAVMFAKGREWLDQEVKNLSIGEGLTREQLAHSVVHILQYDQIASFMNEKSSFSDIATSNYKGAIHVVSTLGIMQGNHGKFSPDSKVTKAEAAVVMMRMVKLQDKLDQAFRDERY